MDAIHLSIRLPLPFIYLSIHLASHPFSHLFIQPFVRSSAHPSINRPIHAGHTTPNCGHLQFLRAIQISPSELSPQMDIFKKVNERKVNISLYV